MTYYPEPFHNKYKSDVRLLYGLLLKVHFGDDVDFLKRGTIVLKFLFVIYSYMGLNQIKLMCLLLTFK